MRIVSTRRGVFRPCSVVSVVSALAVVMVSLTSVNARQQPAALGDQIQSRVKILQENGPWKMDLLRDPGVVLAEGKNTVPTGQLRLKSYRIEEVALRNPISVEIDGLPAQMNKAWRLTITGGPFRVRDATAIIWIDGKPVGFGTYSPDLNSISVLIFDETLLHNGSTIELGYGARDPGRTELPEKITMSQ